MLEIKVNVLVGFAPEVLSLIKGLVLNSNSSSQPKVIKQEPEVKQETKQETKKEVKQEEITSIETKKEEPEIKKEVKQEPETSLTVVQLRAAVREAGKKHTKEKVKAILKKFKVDNVSSLKEEKYEAFYNEIKEMI